jgi:hypothetical protein
LRQRSRYFCSEPALAVRSSASKTIRRAVACTSARPDFGRSPTQPAALASTRAAPGKPQRAPRIRHAKRSKAASQSARAGTHRVHKAACFACASPGCHRRRTNWSIARRAPAALRAQRCTSPPPAVKPAARQWHRPIANRAVVTSSRRVTTIQTAWRRWPVGGSVQATWGSTSAASMLASGVRWTRSVAIWSRSRPASQGRAAKADASRQKIGRVSDTCSGQTHRTAGGGSTGRCSTSRS